MTLLYVCGILTGILVALLFKKTLFRGEAVPFVMELPNYRLPALKNVLQLLWEKAKDFLQRAFTVILVATIVVWFLQSFDLRFNLVSDCSRASSPMSPARSLRCSGPLPWATGASAPRSSPASWPRRAS